MPALVNGFVTWAAIDTDFIGDGVSLMRCVPKTRPSCTLYKERLSGWSHEDGISPVSPMWADEEAYRMIHDRNPHSRVTVNFTDEGGDCSKLDRLKIVRSPSESDEP